MGAPTLASYPFSEQRAAVVSQLEERGITQTAVLHAINAIPREQFIPSVWQEFSYCNQPLPIPGGQTISQIFIIATMIQALNIQPNHRVLEIGSGSGYAAAILCQLSVEVYAVERLPELVAYAQERLAALDITNVAIRHANGTLGWPEAAPFDAILVSAGGPHIPKALKMQLAVHGRLVMPVGETPHYQALRLLRRISARKYTAKTLAPVAFVPLVGANGWPAEEPIPTS